MRLFIAGQKAFGAAVLELAIRAGHQVVGASAPAHAATGATSGEPLPDRLRAAAERAGVPWLRAGTLHAGTLPDGVDLIVAAHAHDFIGRATRLRAVAGAIGYHPSLLPLHRGRDAVRWAVHNRERVTGGSVYVLTDNIDAGAVLAREHAFIRPDDTPESLWRRELFPIGLRLLGRVLGELDSAHRTGRLLEGLASGAAQDESLATWEPSWERAPLRRPDLLLLGDGRPALPPRSAASTHHGGGAHPGPRLRVL